MEPLMCKTCGNEPRRKGRSYCVVCDRARQRINRMVRDGYSEAEIVEAETEYRVRAIQATQREVAIAASISQRLRDNPVPQNDWEKGTYDDTFTPEEVEAFNQANAEVALRNMGVKRGM